VQRDDEQDRTQRHKEPALGTLRWVKPAEGPGTSSPSTFEERFGRDYVSLHAVKQRVIALTAQLLARCESASAGCRRSHIFSLGGDLAPAAHR
jgi:hypothetical protein